MSLLDPSSGASPAPAVPAPVAPASAPGSGAPAPGQGAAPPVVTPPIADPAADPLAAVAREEAKRRDAEGRAKASEKAARELAELKELVAKDPLALIERLGVSYEALTNGILDRNKADTPDAKVASLEARVAAFEQTQVTARQQQAVQQVTSHVRGVIDAAGDKYEHVRALKAHDEVAQRVIEAYRRDGVEPNVDEIAAQVEKEIEEHRAKPLLSLSRYKPKDPAAGNGGTSGATAAGSPTLTTRGPSAGAVPADSLPSDPDARMAVLLKQYGL